MVRFLQLLKKETIQLSPIRFNLPDTALIKKIFSQKFLSTKAISILLINFSIDIFAK